jgi:hypothetical protein
MGEPDSQPEPMVYRYNEAVNNTIPKGRKSWFQVFTFILISISMYSANPVIMGISFLQKEPAKLECVFSNDQETKWESSIQKSKLV